MEQRDRQLIEQIEAVREYLKEHGGGLMLHSAVRFADYISEQPARRSYGENRRQR
jgi:hypothetical protein